MVSNLARAAAIFLPLAPGIALVRFGRIGSSGLALPPMAAPARSNYSRHSSSLESGWQ